MSKSQMKEANVTPPVKGILRHLRWEHLVAGVSGGAASTLLLHPLDLVKIRFQGMKMLPRALINVYSSKSSMHGALLFSACMVQQKTMIILLLVVTVA